MLPIIPEQKTLDDLVQEYLMDEFKQESDADLWVQRERQLPALRAILLRFIDGEIGLKVLRDQLQVELTPKDPLWGTSGVGFMMELNKLIKYHDEHQPFAETSLREVLTEINRDNLGQRIETFCNFLYRDKNRLRQEGKSSNQVMSAGNTAFILSLMTFWLNVEDSLIVYYHSTVVGVSALIKAELLSAPVNFGYPRNNNKNQVITVRTDAEHQAFLKAIQPLVDKLLNKPLIIERFFAWRVRPQEQATQDQTTVLRKEMDQSSLLASDVDALVLREGAAPYTATAEIQTSLEIDTSTFANLPLAPIPEPALAERIRELRQHILIDEKSIRRIYLALLAGHVILTGPPGTGKTELARLIPEILWQNEETTDFATAYTTRLVTATDEWSVRKLIGGLEPRSRNGSVEYIVQHGYLTTTILNNWTFDPNTPFDRQVLRRMQYGASGVVNQGQSQQFRGQWLVIDEFNRAPIDLALGEALTALGGTGFLRVPIEGGSAELPIPQDFRIIGTLNSFDRNYLNQISEALKRRFSFVEILPPTRQRRQEEMNIVLYKALKSIEHLSDSITLDESGNLEWQGILTISIEDDGSYQRSVKDAGIPQMKAILRCLDLFEVIRVYRQLGTAQLIALARRLLISGIVQNLVVEDQWYRALDEALCDTVADQLQVLLPDQIEALSLYLKTPPAEFPQTYNAFLADLLNNPRRLHAQLISLAETVDEGGQNFLSEAQVDVLLQSSVPQISEELLKKIFHLEGPEIRLPLFTRRLRTFQTERGL